MDHNAIVVAHPYALKHVQFSWVQPRTLRREPTAHAEMHIPRESRKYSRWTGLTAVPIDAWSHGTQVSSTSGVHTQFPSTSGACTK